MGLGDIVSKGVGAAKGLMGAQKDALMGRDQTYYADELADPINKAGKKGLKYMTGGASDLNKVYSQNPNKLVNNQIALENRLARGAADDAIMRTRQLVAARGMGNSSIGLGSEINQNRQFNNQLAMNNASALGRIRDMSIENGQGRMATGSALFNTKLQGQQNLQMQNITRRTGGIAGLVGAGAGAYFGGPQGAQAGLAMGQALQNS